MADNPYESPRIQPQDAGDAPAIKPLFDQTLWEIRKEAGNAVLAGAIAFFIGIIFSPVAIMCGRKALRLIEQHDKGHEYERRARLGIKLGYIGIGVFVAVFVLACIGMIIALFFG